MRDYRVRVVRKKGLKQKFHVRIEYRWNGDVLFTSENYVNASYARKLGRSFADLLDAVFEDET
jgi:hypothetical protein